MTPGEGRYWREEEEEKGSVESIWEGRRSKVEKSFVADACEKHFSWYKFKSSDINLGRKVVYCWIKKLNYPNDNKPGSCTGARVQGRELNSTRWRDVACEVRDIDIDVDMLKYPSRVNFVKLNEEVLVGTR